MKPVVYFLTAWLLTVACTALAAESAPDAMVKSTVDEVLIAIKQTKDRQALRQLAEQKVLPHFDFKLPKFICERNQSFRNRRVDQSS